MSVPPSKTPKPRHPGPSLELQRQINDAIAIRSKTITAYDGTSPDEADATSPLDSRPHPHDFPPDEPGIPPPGSNYEYLDHPADILLHSWGKDFPSALADLALAMFGCIASLSCLSVDAAQSERYGRRIVARGHDARSLVYAFLDEWLFNFHDSNFIPRRIEIEEYDATNYTIVSRGEGEVLDLSRHARGVEVKAVTYNAMRVVEEAGRWDVFVVVDI
ncbi:hypothetical protein ACHAW6_001659 [Cyclotella cf. meneghiniana]